MCRDIDEHVGCTERARKRVRTKDDHGHVDRAEDAELVGLLEETVLALLAGMMVVGSKVRTRLRAGQGRYDVDRRCQAKVEDAKIAGIHMSPSCSWPPSAMNATHL